MHSGLIDGYFVPHYLTSAQKSLVPLQKFQLAPRLKNFNILWFLDRNPDRPSFLSKRSRQVNPLQVPQWDPYREGDRYLHAGHFYISLDLFIQRP
jgi:hypothetical protein